MLLLSPMMAVVLSQRSTALRLWEERRTLLGLSLVAELTTPGLAASCGFYAQGMTTNDHIMVTTTHDDEAKARELAAAVVRERLAACAQVYAISSVYWWEGEVQSGPEWRVDFKTRAELGDRLTAFIGEQHSYDTPEIIVVPIVSGSASYLEWINAETAG